METRNDRNKNKIHNIAVHSHFISGKGINERIVRQISEAKNEPSWMLEKRLESLKIFESKPVPTWGVDLSKLDFNEITFFPGRGTPKTRDWSEVPQDIRNTYDKLGIPQAEQKFLAGVVAMYDADTVYENLKKEWEKQGIIFLSTDSAVQKYPDLVKEYFMTKCVPPRDNKFAALHGAVWSGGSFVYVPKGVKIDTPMQAYFRMNEERSGQFEHTLIIYDEGSQGSYVEGCTAAIYGTHSLHSAVVEIFVKKGARGRYTTIQNWSKDIYNLNTKRAIVEEEGVMEWVGGSLGSYKTMLYPCSYLVGKGAKADHLNIALASGDVHKDTGAKIYLNAPYTSGNIVAKSISVNGGWSAYRGIVHVSPRAIGANVNVRCDALMVDNRSRSDTWPVIKVYTDKATVAHEATVGKIGEEELFYLMSRGLSEQEAASMIVGGFIEPISKELPLEYALELNKLILLEMEGSVG